MIHPIRSHFTVVFVDPNDGDTSTYFLGSIEELEAEISNRKDQLYFITDIQIDVPVGKYSCFIIDFPTTNVRLDNEELNLRMAAGLKNEN